MSMKQVGKAVLYPGTPDEIWGICESQELAREAEKKEVTNGIGDTVGLIYTDVGKKKFSGTYTPLAGVVGDNPVTEDELIGECLQFKINDGSATLNIYIDSATFSQKKGDVSEFKIEGYYYPEITASQASQTATEQTGS